MYYEHVIWQAKKIRFKVTSTGVLMEMGYYERDNRKEERGAG